MTHLPPPPTPPKPEPRWPAILAWATILGVVGLILAGQTLRLRRATESAEPSDLQVSISARYAVGLKGLFGPSGGVNGAQLLQSVDATAVSWTDKLRVVAVAGELVDAPAALKRLDDIDRSAADEQTKADARQFRELYEGDAKLLGAEQRAGLTQRHGWYADLAFSRTLAGADPQRRAAISPAVRTMITLLAVIVVVGIALLAGLVLLVVALVLAANRKLVPHYAMQLFVEHRRAGEVMMQPDLAPPALPLEPDASTGSASGTVLPRVPSRSAFLEAFAIYLALMVLFGLLIRRLFDWDPIDASWLLVPAMIVPVCWPLLRGHSWRELRLALGWHAGRGWLREAGAGVVGYVAGLPLLALAALLVILLSKLTGSQASHPIQGAVGHGVWSTVRLYLLAAVYAPVIEETMFRGAFYHHLRQRRGWLLSAAVVAFIFAAIHPQGWVGLPAIATIGFVLATLREWRGSIIPNAVAHACNNFFATTVLVLIAS